MARPNAYAKTRIGLVSPHKKELLMFFICRTWGAYDFQLCKFWYWKKNLHNYAIIVYIYFTQILECNQCIGPFHSALNSNYLWLHNGCNLYGILRKVGAESTTKNQCFYKGEAQNRHEFGIKIGSPNTPYVVANSLLPFGMQFPNFTNKQICHARSIWITCQIILVGIDFWTWCVAYSLNS